MIPKEAVEFAKMLYLYEVALYFDI